MKIGIFGGTFDPVHVGHLRAAEEFAQALGLEKVHLVPAPRPPHRPAPAALANDRLAMLELAVGDNPAFAVSQVEIRRQGPSYTLDTIRDLGGSAGGELPFLALGSDAFREIAQWHRPEEVLAASHVVVLTRPGTELDLEGPLPPGAKGAYRPSGPILLGRSGNSLRSLAVTAMDISSSRIRAMLAAGQSVRYLVPDGVLEYILARGLYAADRPQTP